MAGITSHDSRDVSLAVAGVVHDVNQMLAVITGRAGLMLSRPLDPAWEPHLRAILLASADAAAMLRRLSGPDGGTGDADRSDLAAVVEEARLLVWPAGGSDQRWTNTVPPGTGVGIRAQILREVLVNLLLNALAVLPPGGSVAVSAESDVRGGVRLRLVDSGPGLPAGDPERLFVPGVSGSGVSGRGVGLAACRQLIDAVGGRLTAEPGTAGQGAVFVLDLPAADLTAAEEAIDAAPEPAGDLAPLAVLVVDDEAGVRDMLVEVVGAWGCRVQAFADAPETLRSYRTGSAAVALLDRNLPGISGLDLATRLRARDAGLSIILMTGWQQAGDTDPVDPAVVDRTADKPLTVARIGELLRDGKQLHENRGRTSRGA